MPSDDLLPCPFCGGPAEADYSRYYRALQSGQVGKSIAIYCTQCGADMTHCLEDHRGTDPEDLMADLATAWNRRAATRLSTPAGDAVEVVARALDAEIANVDRIHREAIACGSAAACVSAVERRKGIEAARKSAIAALSAIPERAHGEQMREALAKAAEAKHVVEHKPRRYEPPEGDDSNVLGTFSPESTTTPMVTWAGVAAWLRSLPPPARRGADMMNFCAGVFAGFAFVDAAHGDYALAAITATAAALCLLMGWVERRRDELRRPHP